MARPVCRRLAASAATAAALVATQACRHFEPEPLSPAASAAALEGRSLADPGLRAWLEESRGEPLPRWPLDRWELGSLTLAALYFHPSLDVARAQWQVAQAGVLSAGARPNPTLSITPQYVANAVAGTPAWVAAGALDWPIETAGKRGRRIDGAEHHAAAARLSLDAAAAQVRADLRARLLDFAAARTRAELLAREQAADRAVAGLLEDRVEAGAASIAELAPARLTALQSAADLADADQQHRESRVRLAEALGLAARALDGIEIDFDLDAPPGNADVPQDELRRAALQERPDLLAALADYEASESALRLEIARQYPDLRIGPGYEYDQGLNKWAVIGVTLELPVLDRNQGPIGEAEARRVESAARFLALQATVLGDLDRALANRDSAREGLARGEAILAAERERMDFAQQAMEAGAIDRLGLETARAGLLRAERIRVEAQVRLQQAQGDLEAALARPLESSPTLERSR